MSRPLAHLLCILYLLLAAPQVGARRVAAVDPRTQAMTLRDGADELQKRGQRAAAIQKAEAALSILRGTFGLDDPDTQSAIYQLAVFYKSGDATQAELEASVALFALASKYRLNLAKQEIGRYVNAQMQGIAASQMSGLATDIQQELRKIVEIQNVLYGPTSIEVAGVLLPIAEEYLRQGQYDLAERYANKSLAIAKLRTAALDAAAGPRARTRPREPADHIYHQALLLVGTLQYALGQYSDARNTLASAVRYEQEYGLGARAQVQPQTLLGAVAAALGDPQAAQTHFGLALAATLKDRQLMQDGVTLGMRYLDVGNYERAEAIFRQEQAKQQEHRLASSAQTAATIYGMVIAESQQGRLREAQSHLEELLQITEERIYRGRFGLTEANLLAYFAYFRDHDEALTYSLLRTNLQDPGWRRLALTTALLRKSRVLDELANASPWLSLSGPGDGSAAGSAGRQGESDAQLLTLRRLRGSYAYWVDAGRASGKPVAEIERRLAALAGEIERLEVGLLQRSPLYARRQTPAPKDVIARVAAALPADAVLLEFLEVRPPRWGSQSDSPSEHHLLAILLWPDGRSEARDVGAIGPVAAKVSALLRSVSTRPASSEQFEQHAQGLSQQLLQPLAPLFSAAKTLIIAPDGVLSQVPFAALYVRTGVRLIAQHRLRYVNSGRDLLAPPAPPRALSAPAIFAQPDYHAPLRGSSLRSGGRDGWPLASDVWGDLPGTGEEHASLLALLPGARSFVGAEASEPNLLNLHAPAVLHIATHGKYLAPPAAAVRSSREIRDLSAGLLPPNPLLRSALILAGVANARSQEAEAAAESEAGGHDGIVTALEASGMDLLGTQLVVLSACESGRGDVVAGQGVLGLQRAFLQAGADSVLATLFPVDDRSTATFMRLFYSQLRAGADRSTALQRTMLQMMQVATMNTPEHWAPFVLLGRDGPLALPPVDTR